MKWIAIISEGESTTAKHISFKLQKLFLRIGFQSKIIYINTRNWVTDDGLTVDKNSFSVHENGQEITFQCAYIYSEGIKTKGYIQGYLSLMDIPYISSSPFATMLTTNKFFCKNYLKAFGIDMPDGLKINKHHKVTPSEITDKIGFPCIVKPNIGTDSIGVEKVETHKELEHAIFSLLERDYEVLIEKFIEGREITCGVFRQDESIQTTPVMEIFQHHESFYSYNSKINRNNSKQTPADLTSEQLSLCQALSKSVFEILELKDFVRIDYILQGNTFYLLEVNVTPGMSERSNLPEQLKEMGIELDDFFHQMITAQ